MTAAIAGTTATVIAAGRGLEVRPGCQMLSIWLRKTDPLPLELEGYLWPNGLMPPDSVRFVPWIRPLHISSLTSIETMTNSNCFCV
jgi:hypothetical protein